jgi:hypothetical protein
MSSLALAQLPKEAATPGGTTVVVQEVKIEKKSDTSAKKDGAAPFEAMKKAMLEEMQRREGLPRAQEKQEARNVAGGVAMKRALPRKVQVNVDAQVQQFTQQFRPILRAEYHVLRLVCPLTPEQRKVIARSAEQALREAAKTYSETIRRPMTMSQRASFDPRRQIQEGLAAAVRAQLPAEQAECYTHELAQRTAARKQIALRNLVAALDRELILSAEQREQISKSLLSYWAESGPPPEMQLYGSSLLPPIPDQYLAPYLSETQKRIWRSTQKLAGFTRHMAMFGGIPEEDPSEDEELREARLAASKTDDAEDPRRQAIRQRELMRAQLEMQVREQRLEQQRAQPKAKTP